MSEQRPISRDILPSPDVPPSGLTTYDAKDPETKFPPIGRSDHPKARRTCW